MRPGISQQSITFRPDQRLMRAWNPRIINRLWCMSSRGFESFQRQARSHGTRIGSLARGPLTTLASISLRQSFVCAAVS